MMIVVETIGLDWRGLAGNLFCLSFAMGYMLLPLFAYFLRDWRELQFALSGPAALLLITWWFLPESPRWLLRKGQVTKAEGILRDMARINGREEELPENFHELCARVADVVGFCFLIRASNLTQPAMYGDENDAINILVGRKKWRRRSKL